MLCQIKVTSVKLNWKALTQNYIKNLQYCTKMARNWQEEKERFLNMELDDKRKLYHQKNYKTIKDIKTWKEYYAEKKPEPFHYNVKDPRFKSISKPILTRALNDKMSEAVSVWQGDITTLEIDAIVNAANTSLRGGGGVDGAIHRAASTLLIEECITLNGCSTGDAKMTAGYTLPAKYVIHTVGPQGEKPKLLNSAYTRSLQIALQNHLKIVAFPSISTGVYGYPIEKATPVALAAVRAFLEKNSNVVNRVIFVVFSDDDLNTYERWMQIYFPVVDVPQETTK